MMFWNGWTGSHTWNDWGSGYSATFPGHFSFSKNDAASGATPDKKTVQKRSSDSARRQAEQSKEPVVSAQMGGLQQMPFWQSRQPFGSDFGRPSWMGGGQQMRDNYNRPPWMGSQQMFGNQPFWMNRNSNRPMWNNWNSNRPMWNMGGFNPMWGVNDMNDWGDNVDESLLDPLSSFYFSKKDHIQRRLPSRELRRYSQTWHRFYNPSNFNGSFGGPGMNRNNTNWNRWFNLWAYGPNFWGDTDDMDLYGLHNGNDGCDEETGPVDMVPWYWKNYFRGRSGGDDTPTTPPTIA
nr:hypothetical protein BaRGS_015345 [Batillaria attramentaria]